MYLDNGKPDYVINILWKDSSKRCVKPRSALSDASNSFDGGCYLFASPYHSGKICPDECSGELVFQSDTPIYDIDYFLRSVIAFGLQQKGGYLLHSAGIVRHGKGHVFFGKSGSGKSTVATISSDNSVLSDDLVGILPADNVVHAFSTPFWNPGWKKFPREKCLLGGLYHLVQDNRVYLEPLRISMAISELLASIPIVPMDERLCQMLLPNILRTLAHCGVFNLHFRKDDSFWQVIEDREG